MKKYHLSTAWQNNSFVPCIEEVEVVATREDNRFDIKTKNNIIFEYTNGDWLFNTKEEAEKELPNHPFYPSYSLSQTNE